MLAPSERACSKVFFDLSRTEAGVGDERAGDPRGAGARRGGAARAHGADGAGKEYLTGIEYLTGDESESAVAAQGARVEQMRLMPPKSPTG